VMAGACCLAVECNSDSIDFRLRTNYLGKGGRGQICWLAWQCGRYFSGVGKARCAVWYGPWPDPGPISD